MKKIALKFLFDDDGNKIGIFIKKADFDKMEEELEDCYYYKVIKKSMAKPEKTYAAEEVWAELGIKRK